MSVQNFTITIELEDHTFFVNAYIGFFRLILLGDTLFRECRHSCIL